MKFTCVMNTPTKKAGFSTCFFHALNASKPFNFNATRDLVKLSKTILKHFKVVYIGLLLVYFFSKGSLKIKLINICAVSYN